MEQEAAYLHAAHPEPVRLLGQQLLPYSLGHENLLRRHRSPFIVARRVNADEIIAHLFLGVFICCQRYREAQALLIERRRDELITNWRRRILRRPGILQPRARRNWRAIDPIEKMEAFQAYVEQGSSCPRFAYRKRASSPEKPGTPWLALLLHTLTAELHWSFDEAMDCPYGQAQWLYCAHWESRGIIRLVEDGEEEVMEAIRAEAARRGLELIKVEMN